MVKIAASILSADFSRLGDQVQEAINAGADYIHVDVMDGIFVPNMTFGPMVVTAIKPVCQAAGVPVDVHLMIEKPERLIPEFAAAGANILTVHVETCPHLFRTISQIKSLEVKAGVTLNPATPLALLEEILPEVDQVLIMSVSPGFGNQKMIPGSLARITRLREMLRSQDLGLIEIEVDGGIGPANAATVVNAGADILVVGSAIFNRNQSIADNLVGLRRAAVVQGG